MNDPHSPVRLHTLPIVRQMASRRVLIIGGLAISAVALLLLLRPWADERPNGEPGGASASLEKVTNEEGDYEVSYPPGWSSRTSGSRTVITSADGTAVVGVGLGSAGTLQEASRDLVASLKRSYTALRVDARQSDSFDGKRALLVSGSAKNLSDVALRWLAVSLKEARRTFAVTVFADGNAPPEEVVPPLEAIVSSIRSIPSP